jgi:uncharacterized protein (TIGR03000 family)
MLRAKLFSSAALLAIGLFALTPSVQAQHHGGGGGHGGGGHGGGHVSSGANWSGGHSGAHWSGGHNPGHWSGGAVHHGGFDHRGYGGYYRYGYRPFYGYGFGYWPYSYPSNYYYNSYYSEPYYDDSQSYYDTYAVPDSSYVTPSYTYPSAQSELILPAALNQARLEVVVPDANAEIWIQGAKTTTTGTRRVYVSPALSSGTSYTYTVKCAWSRNGGMVTEQRDVPVTAGATAVVDFTRPAARSQ